MKLLWLIVLFFTAPLLTSAQDGDDFFSDPFGNDDGVSADGEAFDDVDALFEDEMFEYAEEPEEGFSAVDDLLSSGGPAVTWGGRISGSLTADLVYSGLWTGDVKPLDPDSELLTPSVTSSLFFDARPDTDFRAFGKLEIRTDEGAGSPDLAGAVNDTALTADLPEGWSREENQEGNTVIRDADGNEVFTVNAGEEEEEEPQTGSPPGISIEVIELFSDFSYKDKLFFRFGKHTIKWGVGYFWSPADVLNLTAIDIEDPTADREGPVSLKIHYPFDLNNVYLYLITNTGAEPLEMAVAPKFEFVIGLTEIGIAAYYQQALSPRGIITISSSIDDFDIFGEGVVTLGSDRVFIRESRRTAEDFDEPPEELEIVLDTFTFDSIPVFSATLGARYIKEIDQRELSYAPGNLLFVGQYFFNGDGYQDSKLLKQAAFLQQNPEYNGLALPAFAQTDQYEPPPDLSAGDLSPWGRHYGAVTAAWNDIFESEISLSIFNVISLSDFSGIIAPSLSYNLIDIFTINLALRMTYGDKNDEYTNPASLFGFSDDTGATGSLSLSVSMGGGSF